MVKVVVFDVGGTLIGANDIFLEACSVLGRLDLHEELRSKFWEVAGNNPDLSEEQALLLASSLIAQVHGLDESVVAGLNDKVFISSSRLFDGVFDVLSFLKEEGVLMFVASDSDFDLMTRELKNHNIFNFFSDVLTSSLVKAYKPSDVFVERIHQSIIEKCSVPEKIFFCW
jgi:FMN phosphatase YigB (HAD superfamily)